jgi:hypothetical protein
MTYRSPVTKWALRATALLLMGLLIDRLLVLLFAYTWHHYRQSYQFYSPREQYLGIILRISTFGFERNRLTPEANDPANVDTTRQPAWRFRPLMASPAPWTTVVDAAGWPCRSAYCVWHNVDTSAQLEGGLKLETTNISVIPMGANWNVYPLSIIWLGTIINVITFAGIAAAPALGFHYYRRFRYNMRLRTSLCPVCGYPCIRGDCPECGWKGRDF